MTKEEAKKLLALYRSEKLDGAEPGIREALELAQTDPELKRVLEVNTEFHENVKGAIRNVPVPGGLKEQILARRKIVPLWRRKEFLAAAASVAIVIAGSVFWVARGSGKASLANFRDRMMGYAVRSYGMDILTDDPAKVRKFLAGAGAPADFALPPQLESRAVIGGAKLSWHNKPVAMICFKVNGKTAYLFVLNDHELAKAAAGPEIGTFYKLSDAIWSAGPTIYLLGAEIPESELRKLVEKG